MSAINMPEAIRSITQQLGAKNIMEEILSHYQVENIEYAEIPCHIITFTGQAFCFDEDHPLKDFLTAKEISTIKLAADQPIKPPTWRGRVR